MDNRVPLPTDNIYKFYALFGLLLFIFACSAFLLVIRSTNELVFTTLPELEQLKQLPQPSAAEKTQIALLERKLEIAKSDKSFYLNSIGGLMAVGIVAMIIGFTKWHTEYQPQLDALSKAQLQVTELQAEKLRRELGYPPTDSEKPASQTATEDTPSI